MSDVSLLPAHVEHRIAVLRRAEQIEAAEPPFAARTQEDGRRPQVAVRRRSSAVDELERRRQPTEPPDLRLVRQRRHAVQLPRERHDGLRHDVHARVRLDAVEKLEDVGMPQRAELAQGIARERER